MERDRERGNDEDIERYRQAGRYISYVIRTPLFALENFYR